MLVNFCTTQNSCNFCANVVLHVNVTYTAHQIYLEMFNILKINLKYIRFTFIIQPITFQLPAVVRKLLNLNDHCETLSSQSDRKYVCLMGNCLDHPLNSNTFMERAE
jgi:hypothetical protein